MTAHISISAGFSETEHAEIAQLYWAAFSGKLHYVLGPKSSALGFISDQLDPEFSLVARDLTGAILGVAGFKTKDGSLVGGEFSDLVRVYGWWSALWRAAFLFLLEREPSADTLLMDGIFVTEKARGRGVGTALLAAICDHAAQNGLSRVRLDVIDSNPRARALYLRCGFEPVGTEHIGPLSWVFGFRSSTKMLLTLPPAP